MKISYKCQWTAHLPYLGKYSGNYAYSNIRSPRPLLFQGAVPGQYATQFAISPRLYLELFLNILESSRHELHMANGLTLVNPSLCG